VDTGSTTAYNGPFTVFGDGIHTIQFGSVDLVGNVESPRPSQTIDIDSTPPAFVTFPSPLTVHATSASGAVVTFTQPTATDATSGVSSGGVSCAPASGSTFPLWQTTVTCKVVDNAGNVSVGTFLVTVIKTDQTIILTGMPVSAIFGQGPFTLNASATSGLAVALSAAGNCSLSANSLTLTGVGGCTVTATQSGNGIYNGAPTLIPTFTIGQAPTTTTPSVSPGTVQYSDYTSLTATLSPASGGGQSLTGNVQFYLNGITVGSPVPINSSGVAALTQLQVKLSAGTYTVNAVAARTRTLLEAARL
jgi:Bacterial Ig-like domain (group 3)/HYR domain